MPDIIRAFHPDQEPRVPGKTILNAAKVPEQELSEPASILLQQLLGLFKGIVELEILMGQPVNQPEAHEEVHDELSRIRRPGNKDVEDISRLEFKAPVLPS